MRTPPTCVRRAYVREHLLLDQVVGPALDDAGPDVEQVGQLDEADAAALCDGLLDHRVEALGRHELSAC